jgi:hypothetical protein
MLQRIGVGRPGGRHKGSVLAEAALLMDQGVGQFGGKPTAPVVKLPSGRDSPGTLTANQRLGDYTAKCPSSILMPEQYLWVQRPGTMLQ